MKVQRKVYSGKMSRDWNWNHINGHLLYSVSTAAVRKHIFKDFTETFWEEINPVFCVYFSRTDLENCGAITLTTWKVLSLSLPRRFACVCHLSICKHNSLKSYE